MQWAQLEFLPQNSPPTWSWGIESMEKKASQRGEKNLGSWEAEFKRLVVYSLTSLPVVGESTITRHYIKKHCFFPKASQLWSFYITHGLCSYSEGQKIYGQWRKTRGNWLVGGNGIIFYITGLEARKKATGLVPLSDALYPVMVVLREWGPIQCLAAREYQRKGHGVHGFRGSEPWFKCDGSLVPAKEIN